MGLTAELKAKWLEALRGGAYKQGQGQLRTDESPIHFPYFEYEEPIYTYCCLGVLQNIIDPEWNDADGDAGKIDLDLIDDKTQDHLILMNDGHTDITGEVIEVKDFKAIANWIEENVPVEVEGTEFNEE